MEISTIKNAYLYNYSLSPNEVVHQGKRVAHGRLLLDIIEGIYLCASTKIHHEHHATRLQQLVERTGQSIHHGHTEIREEYLQRIETLLVKIHSTALFKTPEHETKAIPTDSTVTTAPICPQPVGRGLSNCGNTCYANAVLNLVLLAPSFRETLANRTSPLSIALREVQTALYHVPDRDKPLSVTEGPLYVLLRELKKIFPNITSNAPQDAEEFLNCLLDNIGYPTNDFTIDEELQPGQIKRSRALYSIIPVQIGALHERYLEGSLQHLIDNSSEKRTVGTTEIECHTKTSLTRAIAPKLLFINLIRYSAHIQKNKPLELKMDKRPILIPEYLIIDRVGETALPYRLHGAVLHNGGHYVMIERTNTGWLCHNDTQVSSMPMETAMSEINQHGVLFSYEEGK